MKSRIVIIGGMGPQASLELHRRLVAVAAKAGARDNQDYPEILHVSIPVPDFISSGDSSSGLERLKQSLDSLQFRPDDRIVLACNTAHLLLADIENDYGLKFISLVQATATAAGETNAERVGLLASPTTIKSGLFEKPLLKFGCKVLLPTSAEINRLERAIRRVIANGSPDQARKVVEPIVQRLLGDGADHIILGCTELSVMFSNSTDDYVLDPLEIICEQLLKA